MLKQSAELPRKLLCKFSKHKAQTEDQPKLEKKNINGAPKGQKGKKKKKETLTPSSRDLPSHQQMDASPTSYYLDTSEQTCYKSRKLSVKNINSERS